MPGERVSTRNIREVLRLRLGQGLPQRAIARSLGLSLGAVNGYVGRARRAGLCWPLPDGLDDGRLEALLYPPPTGGAGGPATGAGLGPGAPRDAVPRRDLGAGMGGI
jgi:Sigma-70, region 4